MLGRLVQRMAPLQHRAGELAIAVQRACAIDEVALCLDDHTELVRVPADLQPAAQTGWLGALRDRQVGDSMARALVPLK